MRCQVTLLAELGHVLHDSWGILKELNPPKISVRSLQYRRIILLLCCQWLPCIATTVNLLPMASPHCKHCVPLHDAAMLKSAAVIRRWAWAFARLSTPSMGTLYITPGLPNIKAKSLDRCLTWAGLSGANALVPPRLLVVCVKAAWATGCSCMTRTSGESLASCHIIPASSKVHTGRIVPENFLKSLPKEYQLPAHCLHLRCCWADLQEKSQVQHSTTCRVCISEVPVVHHADALLCTMVHAACVAPNFGEHWKSSVRTKRLTY